MKIRRLLLVLISITALFGCSSTKDVSDASAQKDNYTKLIGQIDGYFNDSMFAHAHWGVLIKSLRTGRVWYERNSGRMFMPASNEKIPTTSAALLKLGPEFRFETDLSYTGSIKDSVIQGDVVVWSNGDPTLYSRFYNDPRDVFRTWADSLKKLGITSITGNVVADDNAFDDRPFGNGWPVDDLDAWYSSEISSLQINENNLDMMIIPPDSVNGEIIIEPNLPSSYYTIVNNLTVIDTGETDVFMNRAYASNKIVLDGFIRTKTKPFELSPSIHNPSLYYVTVLREVLLDKGIKVQGCVKDCDDVPGYSSGLPSPSGRGQGEGIPSPSGRGQGEGLLIKHYSPPLKEIIKGLMKRSQNLYAETLVKTLGWKYTGLGSFRSGRKIVEEVLIGFGIQPRTYSYTDGSGLSRYNYVSPEQLVKILTGMYNSQYKNEWIESMPIAGVDGTLQKRMRNSRAENNVKAKTGTIANTRGLSGYVKTGDGEELVFSFLVNGHLRSSADTEYITDSVLKIIADYSENKIAGK